MFINSIFLPKNLSDQTLPEGVVNTIGNFSHLFANVFKIVKDGQENPNPIQLFPQTEITAEDIQSELLKVSLLSDNKLVTENPNLPKIVELFLSKIEAGEYAQELADSNKVKISEKTPKYSSMSKEEFVKEIKSILDTLKNSKANQSENLEISLLSGGISISIDPKINSITEIENIINEQLQTNNDFKIMIQNGDQKLTIEVEPIKPQVNKSFAPVEIVEENNSSQLPKLDVVNKTTEQGLELNNNSEKPLAELKENSKLSSAFQSQLQGVKHVSDNLDANIKNENISGLKTSDKTFIQSQKAALNNQTNITKPNAEIISNEIQIPELEKQSQKAEVISKNISSDLNISKIVSDNVKSEILKTTEVSKSDKKISVKSNQKLNSFSVSRATLEDKAELTDLAEKTEVKEIKIDVQSFRKKQSIDFNKPKVESKIEIASSKPLVEKPVQQTQNLVDEKSVETKTEKQVAPDKKFDVKSEPIDSSKSTNEIKQSFTKQEVKSENNIAAKTKPETKSSVQQELFVDNEADINESQNSEVEIKSERQVEQLKSTTDKNVNSVKQNLRSQEVSKTEPNVESKPELKKENSDWFKSKIVVDSKPQVKEIDSKPVETVEVKSEEMKVSDTKSYVENKDVVKILNDEKPVVKNNYEKLPSEKIKTQQSEIKPAETTVKDNRISDDQTNIKPENISKENLKQNLKLDSLSDDHTTELKVENSNQDLEIELSKDSNTKPVEVKNINDLKENKSVKIDFKERRVYSQIPKLEVIADDKSVKNLDISQNKFDKAVIETTQLADEPVKSVQKSTEAKPKDEKQVWVKVSVEKTEVENQHESKRISSANRVELNKNDDVKKDFSSSDNLQDEQKENQKQKPQTVSVESNQNSDTKSSVQTQSSTTQQDIVSSIKPEHKTEQAQFKSELHNENVKYNSRTAEMVEKVKIISSGEMVKEVYKVLENGEKQSVVLKLVPKELGAIKVMLDTIDNVLTAKVEVENESVGQVIRNNVEQLKHNLAQSGVHVNSINISYQSSEQKQHTFNNQKKKNPAYFQDKEIEELEETVVTKKMGYNTYEYLA